MKKRRCEDCKFFQGVTLCDRYKKCGIFYEWSLPVCGQYRRKWWKFWAAK